MALQTFVENFYLTQNPDVFAAVRDGLITAEEHYIKYGELEGRQPNPYFNPKDYIAANSDVVSAVANGIFSTFLEHFEKNGVTEGRQPSATNSFNETNYLAENPDVAAAVDSGVFSSGYAHYVLYGAAEGRAPGVESTTGFALTNETDIATANLFESGLVYTPGGNDRINALQDEDQLTGTGTNPTLNATLGNANDNGDIIITPKLTGIETVNVAFTGSNFVTAVVALDLQDATALNTVNITRISEATDMGRVENMKQVLATMGVANSNSNDANGVAEFSFGTDVLQGANVAALNLDNVQINAINIGQNNYNIGGVAAAGVIEQGYEELTVNSAGSPNTVGNLNLPMDTGTAGKVTITGDQNLTLATVASVTHPANTNLVESTTYAGGINQAQGRLAAIDASALTGDLTLDIAPGTFTTGKADTSGVDQDVVITGGIGDDTFILRDQIQTGDSLTGGEGTDKLIVNDGGVINSASSVIGSIESVEARLDGLGVAAGGAAAAIIDFDKLPDVTGVLVRNEGSDNNPLGAVSQAQTATFTLNNLTDGQATAITIAHSNSSGNGITENLLNANLKSAGGASNLANVAIIDGYNVDPRFNFTLNAANVENQTITDTDTESNTVALGKFTQHTGTVVLTDGEDGDFLNLDTTTVGANGGLYQYNTTGAADVKASLNGVGRVADHSLTPNQVKLGAAVVDAANEVSDVIVRVSTNNASTEGAQQITMGAGDDTVIFDNVNDTNAGLSISDTVTGGEGNDTLAIDGNFEVPAPGKDASNVSLDASEWTNVSGFETVRTIGAGAGSYKLVLTDSLIDANHDADGFLHFVNDNDAFNDNAYTDAVASVPIVVTNTDGNAGYVTNEYFVTDTEGKIVTNADGKPISASPESAVILDAHTLADTTKFTYDGEEGLTRTPDRIILSAANLNGGNLIDGGAIDNITNNSGWSVAGINVGGSPNIANSAELQKDTDLANANYGNDDVLEIRNETQASLGDLANIKNIGILSFTNSESTPQDNTLQLNDEIVDNLVDSYQASVARDAANANVEVLRVNAIDHINETDHSITSFTGLSIEASTLTNKSDLDITLGRGTNKVMTGDGADRVVLLGDYLTGTYAGTINGVDLDAQANNQALIIAGGANNRVVTDTLDLGAGNDTLETYGAMNLTGATLTGIENLVIHSDVTILASQLAGKNVTFSGATAHNLNIVDDGATVNMNQLTLEAAASDLRITTNGTKFINVPVDESDIGNVFIDGVAPYRLTVSQTTINETSNASVTVTFTTTDIAPDTVLDYTIVGNNVTAEDFKSGLTGSFTIGADGTATTTLTAEADSLTEGLETFVVKVGTMATSDIVTITDTSLDPTAVGLSLTANVAAVNEGASGVWTLNLTNGAADQAYSVNLVESFTGATAGDVGALAVTGADYDAVTGLVTFAAGIVEATITIPFIKDASTPEDSESVMLTIADATNGAAIIDASATVAITDVAPTAGDLIAVTEGNVAPGENAADANLTFQFTAGTYDYNIAGFATGDVLDFPDGSLISVFNSDFADGNVDVLAVTNEKTMTIHLTGLATPESFNLSSADGFNTVFGAGSLI